MQSLRRKQISPIDLDPASTPSVINVGDYALRLLEYGRKDNKPARKLMQRWDGPYKVLWHDKTRSLYQFDVGKEQFHNFLHVS